MTGDLDPTTTPAPGRRASRRSRGRLGGLDLTTMLAVLLPVLCVLAVLLVQPDESSDPTHRPTRTALTTATVVCPPALADAPAVALTTSADQVSGHVVAGSGKDTQQVPVETDRISTFDETGPVPVTGEDETAPGLVASRFGDGELAAGACLPPLPSQWFTGVGAGAGHRSVLELVNPDRGTAVADVTVYGRSGVVDVPRLRGVSVPGGGHLSLDLAQIVPRRDELAIEVVTSRGRLGASVLDRFDRVGSAKLTEDWLPGQAAPATSNLLMGLPAGPGGRALVVANGGPDEVRVDLKIVTPDSVFAPEGVAEIRVAPDSVQRVALPAVLGPAIRDGATGLLVSSSGPVTATVRSLVSGDLSHAVSDPTLSGPATVLLPAGGRPEVVLTGGARTGSVSVVAWSRTGTKVTDQRLDVTPGRGVTLDLPAAAALVTLTPSRSTIAGAVLVSSGRRTTGAAVVPLREPVTSGLVPDVRPGLS